MHFFEVMLKILEKVKKKSPSVKEKIGSVFLKKIENFKG